MLKKQKIKIAVVTGGARGIGLGIGVALLEEGYSVILWDKSEAVIDVAKKLREQNHDIHGYIVDVTDIDSVREHAKIIQDKWDGISLLVNNAGINGPTKPTYDYTFEEWNRVVNVNLNSAFICFKFLYPLLKKASNAKIINMGSIAGKEGNANISAYSSAKAGLMAFTKSLSKELIDENISVHALAPAMIETDLLLEMTDDYIQSILNKIPMKRLGKIEEVAAAILWLSSDKYSFSTGSIMDLSGGRATY